jgi:hypothetical protein
MGYLRNSFQISFVILRPGIVRAVYFLIVGIVVGQSYFCRGALRRSVVGSYDGPTTEPHDTFCNIFIILTHNPTTLRRPMHKPCEICLINRQKLKYIGSGILSYDGLCLSNSHHIYGLVVAWIRQPCNSISPLGGIFLAGTSMVKSDKLKSKMISGKILDDRRVILEQNAL